jgi:hypothetical protein
VSRIETVALYPISTGGCDLPDIFLCALTALLNWNLDSIELILFFLTYQFTRLNME